ncbi:unnamed protein product, partial [Meganyctiphanes norvegica]
MLARVTVEVHYFLRSRHLVVLLKLILLEWCRGVKAVIGLDTLESTQEFLGTWSSSIAKSEMVVNVHDHNYSCNSNNYSRNCKHFIHSNNFFFITCSHFISFGLQLFG